MSITEYLIRFDRVGRNRNVPDARVAAETLEQLTEEVQRVARGYLLSSEVWVSIYDDGTGLVGVGDGSFTWAPVEAPELCPEADQSPETTTLTVGVNPETSVVYTEAPGGLFLTLVLNQGFATARPWRGAHGWSTGGDDVGLAGLVAGF